MLRLIIIIEIAFLLDTGIKHFHCKQTITINYKVLQFNPLLISIITLSSKPYNFKKKKVKVKHIIGSTANERTINKVKKSISQGARFPIARKLLIHTPATPLTGDGHSSTIKESNHLSKGI